MIDVDIEKCKADVDASIVRVILPMCYRIIDELLDHANPPKELMVRARQMLPKEYKHTFIKGK